VVVVADAMPVAVDAVVAVVVAVAAADAGARR
jgi:hypothetical protein